MRFKKLYAIILAAATVASMSACGNSKTPENTKNTEENTTTTSENTTTAAATTTSATTTEAEKTDEDDNTSNDSDDESVTVYYGWDIDDADCIAEIYCPEGAVFDDYTLEVQEKDGWVLSASIQDEINGYSAVSNSYWHRDAYLGDLSYLSILQQLYFEGEIDPETAKEYSGCSQKVTPLGFQWEDKDVILIETTYTFMDYPEQTDLFVGVEYDLNYWKVDDDTSETIDLTTKGLFGFDVFAYGWGALAQKRCAWIAGELFGVDSGITDPFAESSEESEIPDVEIDPSVLLGKWVDSDSAWKDTYFFDYDGLGSYTSGFESTFTYSLEGNQLTVFYAEDDIDIFSVTTDGENLILVDESGYEQCFEKVFEEVTDDESDNYSEEETNPNITAIIGTWKENTTGCDETFTFNADGTGYYSCLNEDGVYECTFLYEFFSSDYVDIYYDDGDIGGFLIAIDGDTMTVKNDFVMDLTYTRQ